METNGLPVSSQTTEENAAQGVKSGADLQQADSGTTPHAAQKQEQDSVAPEASLSPEVQKLLQSALDRERNKYGHELKELKKQLEKEKKNGMTAAELADYEKTQRERELAEREKMILDRENRYFALQEVTALGYTLGTEQTEALVSLVMAQDQRTIRKNTATLKTLVDGLVKAEVDKTFRRYGTTPNGAKNGADGGDDDKTKIASALGKAAANRKKNAQSVLNHYLEKKG